MVERNAEALFTTPDAGRFGRRQRRARGARIPVTVVTGFLGSGKTTLIRELLARPEGANTAVVINEYGEVGIDDAAVARVERRHRAARQRVCVLHGAHRPAGEPAGALRRPGARRGAELSARDHRDQRSRRSRSGIADLRQRPGARRGIPPAGAGRGGRCAGRRRQSRAPARGAAPGGARRPHRAEQDRPGRRGGCHQSDRPHPRAHRGAGRHRQSWRDRPRLSAGREPRPAGPPRRAGSHPWARPCARPHRRHRQLCPDYSRRRCHGRCWSRRWRC